MAAEAKRAMVGDAWRSLYRDQCMRKSHEAFGVTWTKCKMPAMDPRARSSHT
jgi:hypothetical protein